MSQSDRQDIAFALEIITDFQKNDGITELEYALSLLSIVDTEAYPQEMEMIRTALRHNEALNQYHIKHQISIPSLAKKGYWWWDPSEW